MLYMILDQIKLLYKSTLGLLLVFSPHLPSYFLCVMCCLYVVCISLQYDSYQLCKKYNNKDLKSLSKIYVD